MIPSILARWWVWLYAIAVLGVLAYAWFSGSTLPQLLALAVIVLAVPVNGFVAVRLRSLSHEQPNLRVLRERALLAVHLSVVVTIFALVFLNNGMEVPLLDQFWTMVVTRTALLSLVIPALRWLYLYRGR